MSIVIPPPPDFRTHDEEVPEFNSGTPSRTWYHYLLILASLVFAAVSVGFIGTILWNSLPEWGHHAGTLLGGDGWQAPLGPFGGLAMIVGTLETSIVALVIAVVIGLGTSISIVFLLPRQFRNIVATLVELLAAVPERRLRTLGLPRPRPVDDQDRHPVARQLALRQADLRATPGNKTASHCCWPSVVLCA